MHGGKKNMPSLNFFLMFLNFWQRETQSVSGGGAESEGDTESEAGFKLWAVSPEPDSGLKPTNRETMTWAEVRRFTDWATQAPQKYAIFLKIFFPRQLSFNLKRNMNTSSAIS